MPPRRWERATSRTAPEDGPLLVGGKAVVVVSQPAPEEHAEALVVVVVDSVPSVTARPAPGVVASAAVAAVGVVRQLSCLG